MAEQKVHNLTDLLDTVDNLSSSHSSLSMNDILKVIGLRSFGPVLVLIGLVWSTPVVGDIPGVPTVIGLLLLVIAFQLLVHRRHIWLPKALLNRTMKSSTIQKGLAWVRRPASWIDSLLRPRLYAFSGSKATYAIIIISILLALASPSMEIVPFSANLAGLVLLSFGLGLIANDGLLNLIGFLFVFALVGLMIYTLL